MELHLLRVFVEVARQGTTTRAALALGRTQPSVSMALKQLQEGLGVRLFERSGRRNRLTDHGRALLEPAGRLLEEWEALPRAVRAGAFGGPVRVGAGEGAALYLLPGAIRAFRRRWPEVQVVVRNQSSEETLAMLSSGEVDFGLRAFPSPPPGTDYVPRLAFDRVVLAPRAHPIQAARRLTLALLSRHPFVMPWPQSSTRRRVTAALEAAGLPCRIAVEGGGWEIVKRYVQVGLGIAVVPAYCIRRRELSGLKGRPASHLFGRDTYGIVVRRGRVLPEAVRELARLIDPRFPGP